MACWFIIIMMMIIIMIMIKASLKIFCKQAGKSEASCRLTQEQMTSAVVVPPFSTPRLPTNAYFSSWDSAHATAHLGRGEWGCILAVGQKGGAKEESMNLFQPESLLHSSVIWSYSKFLWFSHSDLNSQSSIYFALDDSFLCHAWCPSNLFKGKYGSN